MAVHEKGVRAQLVVATGKEMRGRDPDAVLTVSQTEEAGRRKRESQIGVSELHWRGGRVTLARLESIKPYFAPRKGGEVQFKGL